MRRPATGLCAPVPAAFRRPERRDTWYGRWDHAGHAGAPKPKKPNPGVTASVLAQSSWPRIWTRASWRMWKRAPGEVRRVPSKPHKKRPSRKKCPDLSSVWACRSPPTKPRGLAHSPTSSAAGWHFLAQVVLLRRHGHALGDTLEGAPQEDRVSLPSGHAGGQLRDSVLVDRLGDLSQSLVTFFLGGGAQEWFHFFWGGDPKRMVGLPFS